MYILRNRGLSVSPPVWVTPSGRLFRESPGIYTTVNYSTTVQAESFTPVTYSVVSGFLPAGMSLNQSTGVVSGTPSGVSDFTSNIVSNFTIRAQNSGGFSDRAFNIRVDSFFVGRVCHPHINEGSTSTANAPSGFTFTRVDFSSYGTPGGSCPNYTISGCHSGSRPGNLSQLPRTSITVSATNSAFGDPCRGTVKRFRGVYSFSPINP